MGTTLMLKRYNMLGICHLVKEYGTITTLLKFNKTRKSAKFNGLRFL